MVEREQVFSSEGNDTLLSVLRKGVLYVLFPFFPHASMNCSLIIG